MTGQRPSYSSSDPAALHGLRQVRREPRMGLDEDPLAELERLVSPQTQDYDPYEGQVLPGEDYDDPYRNHDTPQPYIDPHYSARRSGKRGLSMVGVVFGLVLLAGIGVGGYRFLAGESLVRSGEPPIIKADATPIKIMPDKPVAADANQQGKLIYDRVNGAAQDANVVASAEEPVERPPAVPREVSRVILPGGSHTNDQAPKGGDAPQSEEDMRKVRTFLVKPEGYGTASENNNQIEPLLGDSVRRPTSEGAAAGISMAGDNAVGIMVGGDDDASPAPANPMGVIDPPPALENVPMPAARPALTAFAEAPVGPPPQTPPGNTQVVASAAPQTAGGGFVVQLASTRSDAEARQTYGALQKRFPQVLSQYQPLIQSANLGERGIFYRLRVGPFSTQADAVTVCSAYKEAGGECIVQKN
jgi:cell division septation protein DedD